VVISGDDGGLFLFVTFANLAAAIERFNVIQKQIKKKNANL
jgi:hypothetical protein